MAPAAAFRHKELTNNWIEEQAQADATKVLLFIILTVTDSFHCCCHGSSAKMQMLAALSCLAQRLAK
jgi:hypothetical protein